MPWFPQWCDLKASPAAVTLHGSIWGLVMGRGIGLGLNGSPVAEGQWCFPDRGECFNQELPGTAAPSGGLCLPPVETGRSASAVSRHSYLLELFLSTGYLKDSFCIRQTQNEEYSIKNANAIQDAERLWKYSWLKEAKETWQLKAIPRPGLDPVMKRKNAIKDIIGSPDKTGVQMVNNSIIPMFNLLKLLTILWCREHAYS